MYIDVLWFLLILWYTSGATGASYPWFHWTCRSQESINKASPLTQSVNNALTNQQDDESETAFPHYLHKQERAQINARKPLVTGWWRWESDPPLPVKQDMAQLNARHAAVTDGWRWESVPTLAAQRGQRSVKHTAVKAGWRWDRVPSLAEQTKQTHCTQLWQQDEGETVFLH